MTSDSNDSLSQGVRHVDGDVSGGASGDDQFGLIKPCGELLRHHGGGGVPDQIAPANTDQSIDAILGFKQVILEIKKKKYFSFVILLQNDLCEFTTKN